MSSRNYTTTFLVDQTPQEVFSAITNVRGWWSGDLEGRTDQLGAEFTYRYQDVHYSKQRISGLIPGEKVVWRVVDSDLGFTADRAEWTGTEITFEVSRQGDQTEVRFAHLGLVPELECFDECTNAWGFFINESLRRLITTGEGPLAAPWA
ncbi:MAG: SRPBCC family protein [Candidatus Dormibacteria bacterium]